MTWQLGSTALVCAALAAGFGWYEHRRPSAKLVALVASLAALATAGRVLFAAIPNVQATTDIVLLSGFALGAGPGFAVGAIGALASNFFLGQGPWTPWQMLGWAATGVAGAALARLWRSNARRRPPGRLPLALACALAGLAFGAWMDLFTLTAFAAERSLDSYVALSAAALPFNLAHAIGNALLCVVFGPGFLRLLSRFRRRFEVDWTPSAAGAAGIARAGGIGAAVLCLALCAAPPAPAEAAGVRDAIAYLEGAQNGDGGFGAAPGQRSSDLITGWAVLGLEAGGRSPFDVRSRGHSAIDFVRAHAGEDADVGTLERTVIALRGAGVGVRRFGGRPLLARLLASRRPDGSFEAQVNLTSFGILALRAAGRRPRSPLIQKAAGWLEREQNADGGFAFSARGGASDVDDTGAALQALAAAGRPRSGAARRAARFVRRRQAPDGGFGQLTGSHSNAQSTAWAIQGLVAVRVKVRALRQAGGRSPLEYLASLQRSDGSFRYSRTSAQTPVWVTAQAIAALRRRPLPIPPVRRRSAVARRGGEAAAPARAATARSSGARTVANRTARRPPKPAPGAPAELRGLRPAAGRARVGEKGSPALVWMACAAGTAALALVARRALRTHNRR
jgi:prenyltransferase beta subunit